MNITLGKFVNWPKVMRSRHPHRAQLPPERILLVKSNLLSPGTPLKALRRDPSSISFIIENWHIHNSNQDEPIKTHSMGDNAIITNPHDA
mgnify:CR=1 FL=1